VDRLILKRDLSPSEIADLNNVMDAMGVLVDEAVADDDRTPAEWPSEQELGSDRSGPVAYLLRRARSYPLLHHDEELELGRRVQIAKSAEQALQGGLAKDAKALRDVICRGEEARERFVLSNVRLVLSVAREYQRRTSLELTDLVQEGVIGLMKAVENFDPGLRLKFSTYAVWWVRQAIQRAIADQGKIVRLPVHRHDEVVRLRRMARRLVYEKGGEQPTINDLAEALDWDREKTAFVEQLARYSYVSIEQPVSDENDFTIGDTLVSPVSGPEETYCAVELQHNMSHVLLSLPKKLRTVIERRFGINGKPGAETLESIGRDFGVTRERIRQIEYKALSILRHASRTKKLRGHL
jgi:RNA polymerase primary sigma factor